MGKSQRVMIFVVIGVFAMSVFGGAIALLAGSENNDAADANAELAEQIADAQQQQQEIDQQIQACRLLPTPEAPANPPEVPEYELPTGAVSELEVIDLEEGTGAEATEGSCVVAYYHGTLTDGTVFDSAFERGAPSRFSLLGVIQGWQLGVPGMKEGGVRVLYIPSELAYGEAGSSPVIGPNEDLVFVIELVEVVEI